MRWPIVALSMLLGSVATSAQAQVSIGVGVGIGITSPGVDIGIHFSSYPRLVQVPGYPVYYAPAASANYFFYDGAYWVFHADNWYVSSWYNGPWQIVEPLHVPLYVLRVPVRYYRRPPPYFRGWHADHPPRWGKHWGPDWERHRHGWDRWDRRHVPPAAPLPAYQRNYSGDRYPRSPEHQHSIRQTHYRYQPREEVTRQRFGDHGGWRGEHDRRGPGDHRGPNGHRGRDDHRGHGPDDRGHGHGRR